MRQEMKKNNTVLKAMRPAGMAKWGKLNAKLAEVHKKNKIVLTSHILQIDIKCRKYFPLAFLLFNSVYWSTIMFILLTDDHDDNIIHLHYEDL